MSDHKPDCDCLSCKYPWMDEFVEEDTAPIGLMDAYVNSVKAESRFFAATQPRVAHWASEAMRPCWRLAWFRNQGTEPTNTGFNEDLLEKGTETEERTVELYRMYGEMVGSRVFVGQQIYVTIVEPTLTRPITGKVDLLILENDKWVPVEVKETKDFGGSGYCFKCKSYVRGDPNAWHRFKPTEEHVAQLTAYLHAYGGKKVLGREFADYGYLHYRNRNTSAHLRFKVRYSERFYEHIVAYFRELERVYALPEAPPVDESFKEDRFPCSWRMGDEIVKCAFFDRCWKKPQP